MAMNITRVEWEATGLPSGLSINKDTGVISGTPTDTPTSSVPLVFTPTVKVTTNYGTDSKPITIYVAMPESWKPIITPNQVINTVAEETMTPYEVTGTNVNKTV